MPEPALTTLDATLDAAAIADTLLSTLGGPHLRRRALQRAAVVLCATAWETYVEDTLIWVASRAGESVQRPGQLADSPATAHLAVLAEKAPVELRRAFETTRWKKGAPPSGDEAGARAFAEVKAADEDWLDKYERGPWAELLEMDLRRQVLGLHHWDGPGRHTRGAMPQPGFKTVAAWQNKIYGAPLIEQVRLPGHRRAYVATWLDVLVDVRNASVHRGETPGPLDTSGVRGWIEFVHDTAHELDRHIESWADLHLPLPRRR